MGFCLGTGEAIHRQKTEPKASWESDNKVQDLIENPRATIQTPSKTPTTTFNPNTNTNSHLTPRGESIEPKLSEDETAAETSKVMLQAVGWLSPRGHRRPLSIASLQVGERGALAAEFVGSKNKCIFKGTFSLQGEVVLEGLCEGQKQVLQGQLTDGMIEGYRTIGTQIEEFRLQFQCRLWDSDPTVLSLKTDSSITGIGRTTYGWAAIFGTQTASNIELTLHYPDGLTGTIQGVDTGSLIKGSCQCPNSQDEVFLLPRELEEPYLFLSSLVIN